MQQYSTLIRDILHTWWRSGVARPRRTSCLWARHIVRELKRKAHSLATRGARGIACATAIPEMGMHQVRALCIQSDGGRPGTRCGAGYVIYGARGKSGILSDWWKNLAEASIPIHDVTAIMTESIAMWQAVTALNSILCSGLIRWTTRAHVIEANRLL